MTNRSTRRPIPFRMLQSTEKQENADAAENDVGSGEKSVFRSNHLSAGLPQGSLVCIKEHVIQ